MIDLYCERLDSSFWAEPINALTNLAFIFAAWIVWKHGNCQSRLSSTVWVLIGLMASIGIGSFLFHTFATKLTMILDILPILFFQFVFMWVYVRRIINLSKSYAAGLLAAYIFFAIIGAQFPQHFNGSLSYLPAIMLLLGFGLYHLIYKKPEKFILLIALAVFLLALFFRAIDIMVCPYFPIGTHFIWHLINGFLVYLSARALIINLPQNP